MTTPAFDATAHTYDAEFTDQLLGRWLREQVWAHTPLTAPMRLLELGCGTGEDARHFARIGLSVLATDASTAMLAIAQAKNADTSAQFHPLDLNALPASPLPHAPFDAVFSNFGVINCVENRGALAHFIADHLPHGGIAVIVTMTRTCPIEILWHLAHLHPKQAIRRFFSGRMVQIGNESALRVWYPSHARLRRDFATAGMRLERMVGIGVVLPPSYLAPLVARHPRFFGFWHRCEKRLAHLPLCNRLNDHTLMLFRKTG